MRAVRGNDMPVAHARPAARRLTAPCRQGRPAQFKPRCAALTFERRRTSQLAVDAMSQDTSQDMKLPGPDHPITIEPNPRRVRVTFNGRVVADTHRALILREAGYRPVQYIPRADIDMALLARTAHATHCPYKGDASYFTLSVDGRVSENAAWSYEAPYPAMAEIKEHLAFYPGRVEGIVEGEE
jgi:uncharacterized protein (DUF427 family)